MSEQIVLKPNEFQTQLDAYESANTTVAACGEKTYEQGSCDLASLDEAMDALASFDSLLTEYVELCERDVQNGQRIKSTWMHVDEEAGNTTFGEWVKDSLSGSSADGEGN